MREFQERLDSLHSVTRDQTWDDAQQMFRQADVDKNGVITISEVGAVLHNFHNDDLFTFNWREVDDEYLRAYMNDFDWNDDSEVDIIEFTNFYAHTIENLIRSLQDLIENPEEYK